MPPDFTPPQNLDAEAALIGAAFIDPVVVADCADIIETDFYSALHSDIWRALRSLGEVKDWVTVADHIRKAAPGRYDNTLEAKLQEIGYATPSAYGYEAYARLVKECAKRRNIIRGCQDAAMRAYDGTRTSDEILGGLLNMASLSDGRTGGKLLSEYVAMAESASLSGGVQGVRTGIPSLDEAIGGLVPGRLIVVGARPGQGKSSLIAQMGVAVMDAGVSVLVFSMEMSGSELAARMIASRAQVDGVAYMRGKLNAQDRAKTTAAAKSLDGSMFIDQDANLDIAELRLRAIRHRAKYGDLGCIIVDYLGLAKAAEARGESRYLQVGQVSRGLKVLSQELKVPVVAAHQINRGAEHEGKQQDQRPKLSQLRESGNIEQDADQVILIWPFQKDPRTGTPVDWKAQVRPVELFVAKNRHGPQSLLYLDFHKQWTTFSECGKIPPQHNWSDAEKHEMFSKPLTPYWTEKQSADKE